MQVIEVIGEEQRRDEENKIEQHAGRHPVGCLLEQVDHYGCNEKLSEIIEGSGDQDEGFEHDEYQVNIKYLPREEAKNGIEQYGACQGPKHGLCPFGKEDAGEKIGKIAKLENGEDVDSESRVRGPHAGDEGG